MRASSRSGLGGRTVRAYVTSVSGQRRFWADSLEPYMEGIAELDWSGDGARLVYHTPGPGDPMFVRRSGPPSEERQIFAAPEGMHSHFVLWAPDQSFIYFVQGRVPDRMDIWRIRPTGGTADRMTTHDSAVSYPVFVDK